MVQALIYIIAFNLFLSALVGMAGSERRIGFWESFFFSVLLTPIIGLIICLLSPTLKDLEAQKVKKDQLSNGTQKPFIAEELERLADLRDRGILSEVEYSKQKDRLIS